MQEPNVAPTKEITLVGGDKVTVFEKDFDRLNQHFWHKCKACGHVFRMDKLFIAEDGIPVVEAVYMDIETLNLPRGTSFIGACNPCRLPRLKEGD